ncbi:Hypothetical predicted protein [Cloeon dipterum]|uniref:C-type lectin domain-containing protein n=2 Tax=Cloeon dipterum TaxID=197152 RepID=A0A8S1D432_9INSE|nr:Hypothetical predicted protein [Cloeon dipterum]
MTMSPVSVLLLAVGLCALVPISEQQTSLNRNSKEITRTEVARQNRITQQILAQYLQKKLFPHLTPVTTEAPPVTGNSAEQDAGEALDSDESEQISSHVSYDDEEGNDCSNCVDDSLGSNTINRWTMPLLKLGEKRYYLGIFFKANWYKANRYCRYHGMQLASIDTEEENKFLQETIASQGFGLEHFWTSGTDQGEEGHFFWMSTGRPLTFTNWNAGEPNNFRYENGEEEHCLELWNRDGKGLKWNDTPCSFETYFVCEVN